MDFEQTMKDLSLKKAKASVELQRKLLDRSKKELANLLSSIEEMEKNSLANTLAGQMILGAVRSRYGDVAGRLSLAEDQLKAAEAIVAAIESGKDLPSA